MNADRIKMFFILAILIGAFIVAPNMAKDLFASCKNVAENLKDTSQQMRDSMKENPIKLTPDK